MVCCHFRRFLLTWSHRVVRSYSLLRKHLNEVQPVVEVGFHSYSVEVCERSVQRIPRALKHRQVRGVDI